MTRKLPLFNERIYAPYKIAALVEVLSEQGIPAAESLKGSGVDEDQILRCDHSYLGPPVRLRV
jgi:hypothetical protein